MQINTETARAIVSTYRQIHELKQFLSGSPFVEWKDFLESGHQLSGEMQHLVQMNNEEETFSILEKMISHVELLRKRCMQPHTDIFTDLDAQLGLVSGRLYKLKQTLRDVQDFH